MSDLAIQKPLVTFPENACFVRPITDTERRQHPTDDSQPLYYMVVDTEGEPLAMVAGKPIYAFKAAREKRHVPQWMH
jgi:hypothetical protein